MPRRNISTWQTRDSGPDWIPYLDVYTAETSLLTQQQTYVSLRVSQMTSNVQLIEAIGGGWDRAQLPSEKEVAKK